MHKQNYDYIKDICNNKNIKYVYLKDISTFIFEKDGIKKYFNHNKLDLNGHAIGKIIDNKYETYKLLNYFKFPIVPHINVKSTKITDKLLLNIEKYFNKFNREIIMKPNHGTIGNSVYKVTKIQDLKKTLTKVFMVDDSISISPFLHIKNEYRVFILDEKLLFIYSKVNPTIIGDGKKTVLELLCDFNNEYFKKHLKIIKNKSYIPKINEKIDYDFRFNLSKGAIVKEVCDIKLKEKIEDLATKVAKKLNLKFVTIDIVLDIDDKLSILEINSGVSIKKFMNLYKNGKEIGYQIYSKAFDYMFKK